MGNVHLTTVSKWGLQGKQQWRKRKRLFQVQTNSQCPLTSILHPDFCQPTPGYLSVLASPWLVAMGVCTEVCKFGVAGLNIFLFKMGRYTNTRVKVTTNHLFSWEYNALRTTNSLVHIYYCYTVMLFLVGNKMSLSIEKRFSVQFSYHSDWVSRLEFRCMFGNRCFFIWTAVCLEYISWPTIVPERI